MTTPSPADTGIILVVDDEPLFLDMAQTILTVAGYRVEAFGASRLALDYFIRNSDRVSLLLTDQIMPGITGLNLASEIHQLRTDLPVVLMTGYAGTITPEALSTAALSGLIFKPFRRTELLEVVAGALTKESVAPKAG